jgi:hypothetical protein
MLEFKRNQVEEAISGVLEPGLERPSPELRTRLKRLLETDRALGLAPRSPDPERAHYAFYSADAPGSGVEVWFSEYEAFALLNGLRLMAHGWPQTVAVSLMRRVRAELEQQHVRILKQDPQWLFDEEKIRRSARPGDMAFDNIDPVLLTIVSKTGMLPSEKEGFGACDVCRGARQAMQFAWKASGGAGAWTMFELVSVAHRLSKELAQTEPRRRGRSG